MSKITNKIINYFEKYNRELMSALMSTDGSAVDYEEFCSVTER